MTYVFMSVQQYHNYVLDHNTNLNYLVANLNYLVALLVNFLNLLQKRQDSLAKFLCYL